MNDRRHDFIKNRHRIRRIVGPGYQICKETAFITCMTGSANLDNLCQDRVLITINIQGFHILIMTGSISFFPKLLTAPAPVGHPTASYGLIKGFFIHIGNHENFACFIFLSNDRNQSVTV